MARRESISRRDAMLLLAGVGIASAGPGIDNASRPHPGDVMVYLPRTNGAMEEYNARNVNAR